jgi:hypothetical protein
MRASISDAARPALRFAAVLAFSLVAGCQSIGPASVQRDRLDYADAIAGSWREQTLLNIVKLRYFDAPVFLEVSSVIGSYTLQGEVRFDERLFPSARGSTYRNSGVTGTFTDHPTVSYTPVTGQKYIDKLLRPIPPQAIFAMIQAGHPADYILSLSVRGINGVFNYSSGPMRQQREDPAFSEVVDAIHRLQQAGALDIRTERRGKEEATLISFRDSADPKVEKDVRFVRDTLGIKPASKELVLGYGSSPRDNNEIALLTRSMWEILAELSSGVEVPERDIAEGRAVAVKEPSARPRDAPVVHVHSGEGRPPDAYIAARYRDRWFWIDDRDLASKRLFAFLMVFSSIAETGAVPQVPVITIPAN